jgi:hypothetical protein
MVRSRSRFRDWHVLSTEGPVTTTERAQRRSSTNSTQGEIQSMFSRLRSDELLRSRSDPTDRHEENDISDSRLASDLSGQVVTDAATILARSSLGLSGQPMS